MQAIETPHFLRFPAILCHSLPCTRARAKVGVVCVKRPRNICALFARPAIRKRAWHWPLQYAVNSKAHRYAPTNARILDQVLIMASEVVDFMSSNYYEE